jgi:hypothetical protein
MLCTEPVIHHIQGALNFQAVAITTPPATFGPVPNTLPPGVVYQGGFWVMPDDAQMVPIRFLHFEPQRIVIDVAGPSTALEGIYQRIREEVSPITAPDGHPIIGTPVRVLRVSELSVPIPIELAAILSPGLGELITRYLPGADRGEGRTLAPTLQVRSVPSDQPYPGDAPSMDGHTFSISTRTSTTPDQHDLFSTAPLETEKHIQLVNELVALLSPRGK